MITPRPWTFGFLFWAGAVPALFLTFLLRFDWQFNLMEGDRSWFWLYFIRVLPVFLLANLPSAICFGLVAASQARGKLRTGLALLLAVATAYLGMLIFFMALYAVLLVTDALKIASFVPHLPRSIYVINFGLTSVWAMLLVACQTVALNRGHHNR